MCWWNSAVNIMRMIWLLTFITYYCVCWVSVTRYVEFTCVKYTKKWNYHPWILKLYIERTKKWSLHNLVLSWKVKIIKLLGDFDYFVISLVSSFRSNPPEVFLRKGALKKCSRFTVEHPCRNAISIKFAACFQNTFS